MLKSSLFTLLSTFYVLVSFAQCGKDYEHLCKEELVGDHFTPLTIKQIDNHEGDIEKIEYAYQFTKGKKYEFYFDGEMDSNQEITAALFNVHHDLVLSNKNNETHKITFDCKHSGIYYISFTFKEEDSYCGNVGIGYLD